MFVIAGQNPNPAAVTPSWWGCRNAGGMATGSPLAQPCCIKYCCKCVGLRVLPLLFVLVWVQGLE